MAKATYVKEVTSSTGKKQFQATVWHKGRFYASKVCATRGLAVAFKEVELLKAIKGGPDAAQRGDHRKVNEGLDQPMSYWADLYVTKFATTHCATRLADYDLVGRLLANTSLKAFDGKAGAELVESLSAAWYTDRQPRTTKPRPSDAEPPAPLSHSAVRSRLTALLRLIPFAKARLPAGAAFAGPAWDELFPPFKLPPAHCTPRPRLPSDEECQALLGYFHLKSDMGEFIQTVDETGARLGEIRTAHGSAVEVFIVDGEVAGGCLTLVKHKTSKKTGPRKVPLSAVAARILSRRKTTYGNGVLFPALHSKDTVCKQFDKACEDLEIKDLLIKDFRRAFVNRNKSAVSHMDLSKMVGHSSLLPSENATEFEKATTMALGHTQSETTAGYSVLDIEKCARIFTLTSRNRVITGKSDTPGPSELEAAVAKLACLQAQVSSALGHLATLKAKRAVEQPVLSIGTGHRLEPSWLAITASQASWVTAECEANGSVSGNE